MQLRNIPWPTVSIKVILLLGMSNFSSVIWRMYPDESLAVLGDCSIILLELSIFASPV